MNHYRLNLFTTFLLSVIFCLDSCKKASDPTDPSNPPGPANSGITVTSLKPTHGPYNTIDTIAGKGFDQIPAFDSILVNGKKLNILSRSSEQIIVQIPSMTGTGNVDIWYQGKMISGPVFTYDSILMVTTIAGNSTEGEVNGHGLDARFWFPVGIVVDHSGNIYVAEQGGSCIRKIDTALNVTTLAGPAAPETGYADGTGSAARFSSPVGLCIDQNGFLYVADQFNYRVRKVSPAGVVTTFAGAASDGIPAHEALNGDASTATFDNPHDVACDKYGNIYVADILNNKIRKITPAGIVSDFAGSDYYHPGLLDGQGSSALFSNPSTITADNQGNLFTIDDGSHLLRTIKPDGTVKTLFGPTEPGLNDRYDVFTTTALATDKYGNLFFSISDGIIKMTPDGKIIRYATGGIGDTDGPAQVASYRAITGITVDDTGTLFISDNNRIRKIAWQ
jgi:hypothetical protein